jgi:hypothetical protein
MSRSTLRTAVAAVLLVALLLPVAASAREPTRPMLPAARGFISAFWDFLGTFFLKTVTTDNRWTIDPNGATATTCPNGGASCDTTDNRWQIDPNG